MQTSTRLPPSHGFDSMLPAMDTLGQRLKRARKTAGKTQSQIAEPLDVSREAVAQWESDKSKPANLDEVLQVYHRLTGVSPGEMITGVTEPSPTSAPSESVLVDFYPDATASAGSGAANEGVEGRRFGLAFRAESLRRKGINPAKSAVVKVRGRSMEPLLSPGDVVLFDTTQTRIHDGEVYVVHWNGDELVKVLRPLSGGKIMLVSKNPEFEPLPVDPAEGDFRVLGRVMWRSGWM